MFRLELSSISGDLLKFIRNFLSNRKQRVVLNGQVLTWTSVNAGVPQGSIIDLLLLFICINDLSDNLWSSVKLFADDISLYMTLMLFDSLIHHINVSAGELNQKLKKNQWLGFSMENNGK